jgi:hypothetical protein
MEERDSPTQSRLFCNDHGIFFYDSIFNFMYNTKPTINCPRGLDEPTLGEYNSITKREKATDYLILLVLLLPPFLCLSVSMK